LHIIQISGAIKIVVVGLTTSIVVFLLEHVRNRLVQILRTTSDQQIVWVTSMGEGEYSIPVPIK